LLLAIWFIATIYASSKGVRFILLLVPAFSIACGISVGIISRTLSEWVSKELSINRILSYFVITALFCSMLFFPINFVKAAKNTAKNEIPSMNDDWFATLTKIKDESEPDAIINSWWDFGHWFAAIGERAVTLDGGRQNSPQAHWLGKLMLTWNETESMGILRYLDCGANSGFDTLLPYMKNDSLKTINIIYEIIVVEKNEAEQILKKEGLADEQINEVIRFTHCNPPENYFISSEDMVGKSGVWAHFGAWDFDRAIMYNKVHDKSEKDGIPILTDEFGLNKTEANRIFNEIKSINPDQWISPWPSYAGGLSSCTVTDTYVTCQNGIEFNLKTEDASVPGASMNVRAISYIDKNGEFKVKEYEDNYITAQNGRPLGASLIPFGNSYQSVLMDYALTGSMFTRLFYFEGYGLRYFDEFNNIRDVTGAKIITWKIDWEGKDLNMPDKIEKNIETPESNFDADAFSGCLVEKGAKFYGTKTCSWCNKQKETLISDMMPFVDCDENSQECNDAGVTVYPSWIIDDKTITGYQTLEQLSDISGCNIDYLIDAEEIEPTIIADLTEEITGQAEEVSGDDVDEISLVKIEHILIRSDTRTDEEALELADEIYIQVTSDNFNDIAQQFSECSDETLRCSLGWFGKGVMAKEFEEEIFKLKINEFSKPFKTSYGYEIVKLIDTK